MSFPFRKLVIYSILLSLLIAFRFGVFRFYDHNVPNLQRKNSSRSNTTVTIAIVVCGSRLPEAWTLMKSIVLFSRNLNLDLRIFRKHISLRKLSEHLSELKVAATRGNVNLSYKTYDVWFPEKKWSSIPPPCTTQRLFFPALLPDVDKLIYVDTNVLFLSDTYDLWTHFSYMDSSQFIAMVAEEELPGKGAYNVIAQVPYYGLRGLNAGVLLMSLDRMRQMDFSNEIGLIYDRFKNRIKFGDQDLLNIYLHYHPKFIYVLPCDFNYRITHCQCYFDIPGSCACKNAESSGISVLHGNKNTFHTGQTDIFREVYDSFAKFDLVNGQPRDMLNLVKQSLPKQSTKPCSYLNRTIFGEFDRYMKNMY